ncbi:MAG: PilZ domain-containing protein [Thermodesulfovibrionales bacterium]|nr:PilZ domain-containing protein [Thermodesulfovibrionales bacterium]
MNGGAEEKRRYKRFAVEGIHGNILFSSDIRIVNISLGGAAIETSRRLNIGSGYILKLEDKGRVFSVKGKVMWAVLEEGIKSEHGEVVPVYKVGVQFTDIITEKTTELIDFIDSHKKGIDERLTGIRFKITSPDRATLSHPYTYTVKKISLGGMLIESVRSFLVGDVFPMELFLPTSKLICFRGRVASCAGGACIEDMKHYDVGIEFMDISEECRKNLGEFVSALR